MEYPIFLIEVFETAPLNDITLSRSITLFRRWTLACFRRRRPRFFFAVHGGENRRSRGCHMGKADNDKESEKCPVDPRERHDAGDDSTLFGESATMADVGKFVGEDCVSDEVQHPDYEVHDVFDKE